MADDRMIRLTAHEALVLSDGLGQVVGARAFDEIVTQDRAMWAPPNRTANTPGTTIPETFVTDYGTEPAHEHLLSQLGDQGRPPAGD